MTQVKVRRNQSIECARIIASFFVVFIHCSFPGTFGGFVNCLGRFAVPMFFAISGYFCYQLGTEKIGARMKHIFGLYLLAEFAYVLWNIFAIEYQGGSTVAYLICLVPAADEVGRWMFMNIPPYVGHLWYLLGLVTCYVVLWVYVRFFGQEKVDYRPFYLLGVMLLIGHIILGVVDDVVETEILSYWARTGLFIGIPMFALGMFLRQYQQRLVENFNLTDAKLGAIFAVGVVLALIQWHGGVRTGTVEMGTIIGMAGLMLLMTAHPVIASPGSVWEKLIAKFGFLSTAIYVLHLMVLMAYNLLLSEPLQAALGEKEDWMEPLVVLGISIVAAILCERVSSLWKKMRKA